MRSNPLALLRVLAKREAGILILLSLFLWTISVAVSFPPGAITVEQATQKLEVAVPSFGIFEVSLYSLFRLRSFILHNTYY
jgi:hypothetical protein